MKKPVKIILGIVLGVLAALGIFFVVVMFLPEPEEHTERPLESAYPEETEKEEKKEKESKEEGSKEEEALLSAPGINGETVSVGTDAKNVTILIYMNGSDLETRAGEATTDIGEMLSSGVGTNVNLLLLTLGTKEWQDFGISSDTAQIWQGKDGELQLLEDHLGDLDLTSSKTLSDFVRYGKTNFPADRYMLLFWDHGGGPVYGFGYDDRTESEEALTLDSIAEALSEHQDIRFDLIGMDCCIMANMETAMALSPFCKYAVLSEDFESGLGWSYGSWMRELEENPGISTPLLGKRIVDSMVEANKEDPMDGDPEGATLTLINETAADNLFDAWKAYAYENRDALLRTNYSTMHISKGRSFLSEIYGSDESDVTLQDYFISDMLAIVESVEADTGKADELRSALKAAVAYFGHGSGNNELTGLSVSLPYGDPYFYEELRRVYGNLGFDAEYIEWLGNFVDAEGASYDYSDFSDTWGGWGAYEEEYGCDLSGCGTGSGGLASQIAGNLGGSYDEEDEYLDLNSEDWVYDYEDELWYLYDDGLYLYDDETDTMMYYDEYEDYFYYYDEADEEWYLIEDWE